MQGNVNSVTINKQNVELVSLSQSGNNGELSEKVTYECAFCGRLFDSQPFTRRICEKLSGNMIYCKFCLRHGLHSKSNKHVLGISFRGIIGYYYYEKYQVPNYSSKELWVAEIQDYIEWHKIVGEQNPLFLYDPETYMWFIDFSRVGKGKRKIRVREIKKTIINILACFNLKKNISVIDTDKIWAKYEDAVDKFYQNRYRPEGKRHCIPSLVGCGVYEGKRFTLESTKLFTPDKLLRN